MHASSLRRLAALTLMLPLCLCCGCTKGGVDSAPQAEVLDGSTLDSSDPDAPKQIESGEIDRFYLRVSLLSLDLDEDSALQGEGYELSAQRKDGLVSCTRAQAGAAEEAFEMDAAFLDALQTIVETYDLAQLNGRSLLTQGLPDDYGAELSVRYASGETLFASDNEDMFLPLEAVWDFVRAFYGDGEDTFLLHITPAEAQALMEELEDFLLVDVRRADEYADGHIPGAICVPNEDIQAGIVDALPDRGQVLLVYCRSGRRSREAADKLAALGYRRIYEMGGINDWPGEIERTAPRLPRPASRRAT